MRFTLAEIEQTIDGVVLRYLNDIYATTKKQIDYRTLAQAINPGILADMTMLNKHIDPSTTVLDSLKRLMKQDKVRRNVINGDFFVEETTPPNAVDAEIEYLNPYLVMTLMANRIDELEKKVAALSGDEKPPATASVIQIAK